MGLSNAKGPLDRKINDIAINVRDYIYGADSVTSGITDAFNHCYTYGLPLLISDDYTVSASIPYFHDVQKVGYGSITSGGETWYITPVGTQTNTLYINQGGSVSNDGICKNTSVSHTRAWRIMESIGDKASDGHWVICLSGTVTHNGVDVGNLPNFKNRLKVIGELNSENEITSILNGQNASSNYAIRLDNASYNKYLRFENIHFMNWWPGETNKGALVCWDNIDVEVVNCRFSSCGRGIWLRQGNAYVTGCTMTNVLYGAFMQYQTMITLEDSTFSNDSQLDNSVAVQFGRNSAGYVIRSNFTNYNIDIEASQSSRLRTISNTHTTFGKCALSLSCNATWEEGTDEASTYTAGSITQATPAVYRFNDGSDSHLFLGTGVYKNTCVTPGTNLRVENTTSATLLTGMNPLRIPASFFLMKGNSAEIRMVVESSVGDFDIILCGQGAAGGNAEISRLSITNNNNAFVGLYSITLHSAADEKTNGFYHAQLVGESKLIASKTSVINYSKNSMIASMSEDRLVYRMYIQPKATTTTVKVYSMEGFVSCYGQN